MARFDPTVWRSRAYARFKAENSAGRPGAATQLRRSVNAVVGLERLTGWCLAKRIDVCFTNRSDCRYDPNDRTIKINSRMDPECQLHVLLHECGHYLIIASGSDDRYVNGYDRDETLSKNSLLHRVAVVDEEFEAWSRGLKLARRIGINIDENRYNDTRVRYVNLYIRWAAKRRRKASSSHDANKKKDKRTETEEEENVQGADRTAS